MTPRAKQARANLIAMGEAMKCAAQEADRRIQEPNKRASQAMDPIDIIKEALWAPKAIRSGLGALKKHAPDFYKNNRETVRKGVSSLRKGQEFLQNNQKLVGGLAAGGLALGAAGWGAKKVVGRYARKGAIIGGGALAGVGGLGYLAGRGSGNG